MINFCRLPVIMSTYAETKSAEYQFINIYYVLWVSHRHRLDGVELSDECDLMLKPSWSLRIAMSAEECSKRIHDASKEL